MILKNLFQTNFTLNFNEGIKAKETSKRLLSSSPRGPIVDQVEKFNVSISWRKFSRIGTLGSPAISSRSQTVVTCFTGADSGIGTMKNILYVKGSELREGSEKKEKKKWNFPFLGGPPPPPSEK